MVHIFQPLGDEITKSLGIKTEYMPWPVYMIGQPKMNERLQILKKDTTNILF
jgi:hypothetical protein